MHSDPFMRAISRISEAALTPDQWPTALQSIAEAVGTLGAVYYLLNKLTGGVESISVAGFSVDVDEFVNYYAARDLFKPLLEATPTGSWLRLSKRLSQPILRSDEWYNDFIVKAGIGDIVGTRLFDNSSYTVIFGVHEGVYQAPFSAVGGARLQEAPEPRGPTACRASQPGVEIGRCAASARSTRCGSDHLRWRRQSGGDEPGRGAYPAAG